MTKNNLTPEALRRSLRRLSLLCFFPTHSESLEALAEIVTGICTNDEELDGVTQRLLKELDNWPGPSTFTAEFSRVWRELYGPKASHGGINPTLEWIAPWKVDQSTKEEIS
ncbi:MAG: hypothetical protein KJZ78_24945 [Bryobacteraceae bacterium]|nr:hypothetical protein [Bryobacteraceae bacterium]